MHTFFLFVHDFTPWQQHRILSACHTFTKVLDPGFHAEAIYVDKQRVGWNFYLTNDEARRHLIVFFSALTKTVAFEQSYGDPVIQRGYDAAAALRCMEEVAR